MTRVAAVLGGEIGHRPDGVALHLVAFREREEVERPLVAVDHLAGLAGTDRDHLRQVEMEARRVDERRARGGEHERVHHELAAGRRAEQQAAGAARAAPGELVGAEGRGVDVRLELGASAVEKGTRHEALDDGAAVAGERLGDALAGGVSGESFDRHGADANPARRGRVKMIAHRLGRARSRGRGLVVTKARSARLCPCTVRPARHGNRPRWTERRASCRRCA